MKKSFLLIILLNCLLLTVISSQDTLKYRSLGPQDFQMEYQSAEPALLIDVREPFEFKSKRIRGAINIPASGNLAVAADTIDPARAIFLYCTSGARSGKAAVSLYKKGFRKLYSLEGGITEWQRQGMKVEKRRRAESRERGAGSRDE